MTPDVIAELNKEGTQSPFHREMLASSMALVKMSRTQMSKGYSGWDMQDEVYRGLRRPDETDVRAAERGEPEKMVVANTYAQVMSFSSFLFLMFNQNRTFFELNPSGNEDYGQKEQDCEKIMERDLRRNQWNGLLFQHLLDISRFGPAIMESSWTKKMSRVHVTPEPSVAVINGVQTEVRAGSEWQEMVKYEGNLLRCVSPYRFFPDTRQPLTDFQKGEFCAAEEDYSMALLRDLETAGEVAGLDQIQPIPQNWDDLRGGATRTSFMVNDSYRNNFTPNSSTANVVVTKLQRWIVPSKFKIGDGDKVLGPETFPILYHVWYANDNRVIRCEPAFWWHNEFGWTVAQFTPDMHHTMSTGLADLVYRLQDVISWFINSHITSVRRIIANRFVVDPKIIDTETLDGEGDIYLRKGMSVPLERALMQLRVQDVTGGHMGDADALSKMMQMVTGVNDNAMGQYNSGRRSAQEARVVTAGAAGRMKMHGHLIWESSLGRLGRLMLSNSRQSLSQNSFMRVVGTGNIDPMTQQNDIEARYAAFRGTPEEIVCGDDFFMFDSTLASEKGFMAQSLSELLQTILSVSPMAAQQIATTLDPAKMVEEIQYLRGSGSIKRFTYSPGTVPQPPPPPPPAPPPPPHVSIALKGELDSQDSQILAMGHANGSAVLHDKVVLAKAKPNGDGRS